MSKITTIGNVIIAIAADKNDDLGKVLRQLPSIQKELLKREIISLNDLSDLLQKSQGPVFPGCAVRHGHRSR